MLTGPCGPPEDKLTPPFPQKALQKNILSQVIHLIGNKTQMSLIPAERFLVGGVDFALFWVFVHVCRMVTHWEREVSGPHTVGVFLKLLLGVFFGTRVITTL